MTVLRGTKQQRGESVALFAEKLISLAKDAYGDTLPTLPLESYTLIDLQVVAVFSDSLFDKAIRARVIRGETAKYGCGDQIGYGRTVLPKNARVRVLYWDG